MEFEDTGTTKAGSTLHGLAALAVAAALALAPMVAHAEGPELPGGFALGSSLEVAKDHAKLQGWTLVQLSPDLQGEWLVQGANGPQIGLFLCKDKVARVSESDLGNLDAFAERVMALGTEFGEAKPDIQVITFKSGKTKMTNLDARFAGKDGIGAVVQLSRTANAEQVSTAFFALDSGC